MKIETSEGEFQVDEAKCRALRDAVRGGDLDAVRAVYLDIVAEFAADWLASKMVKEYETTGRF